MIETMITLGNRKYRVAYEEGQERELAEAVNVFNQEVESIQKSNDQVRENQLLMMSGLMLAYRFTSFENEKSRNNMRIRDMENELAKVKVQAKGIKEPDLELQAVIDDLKRENAALIDARKAADSYAGKLRDQIDEISAQAHSQLKSAQENATTGDELKLARAELDKLSQALKSAQDELASLKSKPTPEPTNSAETSLASMLGEIASGLEGLAKK